MKISRSVQVASNGITSFFSGPSSVPSCVCLCVCVACVYHSFFIHSSVHWASLIAQLVKNLPAMPETWVRFLGQEDPLEKEMAIYSSILAWRIPWTEEPGGLQSMGSQESDTTWRLNCHPHPKFSSQSRSGERKIIKKSLNSFK